jgi:hypothetical protein
VRSARLRLPFDFPASITGWKIIGDAVEARFSYLNRPKFRGIVGMGFTWSTSEKNRDRSVALAWQALEKYVLPRIIDADNVTGTRLLDSAIEPTVNSYPSLGLRFEGD